MNVTPFPHRPNMIVVIIGAIGAIILPTAAPERTPCQEKAQPSRKKTRLSFSCQRSKLVLDRFFTDSVVNRHTNREMKENIILPNNRDPETDKLFSVHADFFKFCFLFSKRLICKATFMGFRRADFRADHPCRETGCCTSSIHSKDFSTFVNQHHSFRKFSPHHLKSIHHTFIDHFSTSIIFNDIVIICIVLPYGAICATMKTMVYDPIDFVLSYRTLIIINWT